MKRHLYILVLLMLLPVVLMQSCKPDGDKFELSCGSALTIAEGATETIHVTGVADFTITTNNSNVACVKNGTSIVVTGVRIGQTTLTVSDNNGNQLTCTITIAKSDAQKNFINDRTPRVENWLPQAVYTETTAGLQVTRENNIDADGYVAEGTTTFGFYFIESGDFCRISAKTDFSVRGTYQEGKMAICSDGETKYYLCDKIDVQKIFDGHVWIVVTCKDLPEIRIVTEVF